MSGEEEVRDLMSEKRWGRVVSFASDLVVGCWDGGFADL